MNQRSAFAVFTAPCRVWAVASIHGELERLQRLHEALAERIAPGDRLAYLGNMLGRGPRIGETVDEVLLFRRNFLARRGNDVGDFALLRGAQEEMWQKLLELQFAVNPAEVLEWMLDHGVGATLEAYGGAANDGIVAARQGAVALNRWTQGLRDAAYARPGHREFISALRQAAYTDDGALIFVHGGIDPDLPLDAQADSLWWSRPVFDRIDAPYFGCRLVVRGFDPAHRGVHVTPYTASLDAGCGFGGGLVAACITADEGVVDVIEA